MSLNVQVLFNRPQQEIASMLRDRLSRCIETSIVVGFATVDGLEAIAPTLLSPPAKLRVLVVGAGTFRAFDAMDSLAAQGVPPDRLRIHLGHTRPWNNVPGTFQKYHPMLHSKIFYCEMPDGQAAAFVSSHNLPHFAMNGLNGEASVLVEGPASDPQFKTIKEHIGRCAAESAEYDPTMKEALTWWTTQFIDGLLEARSATLGGPQRAKLRPASRTHRREPDAPERGSTPSCLEFQGEMERRASRIGGRGLARRPAPASTTASAWAFTRVDRLRFGLDSVPMRACVIRSILGSTFLPALLLGSGCAARAPNWKGTVEWPTEDSARLVGQPMEAGAVLAAAGAIRELVKTNPFPDLFQGCASPEQGLDVAVFTGPTPGLYYVVLHQRFNRCGGPAVRVLDGEFSYAVTPLGEVVAESPPTAR
ncbi:hypothetical protein ACLESO_09315 [Pyxidicoccus sp. 3LG]